MAKTGFKGQWIPISQIGKFNDSTGIERDLSEDFINKVIANFTSNDAPAVIGHPKDNTPAFGWTSAVRLTDGVLEAQFADTDDEFERMVEEGRFRKRSASFYLNPPRLKHVGFLGAMPPALKGLRDIQFADGESVTVEIISFREENMGLEDKDVEKVTEGVFEKIKGFFKQPEAKPETPNAEFSETDVQQLVADAVKAATADFSEKLGKLETDNQSLRTIVDSQSASGRRSEIMSFVEAIPAEKGKHFLKRAGIADFMESLADADAADEKPAINFSEGEGDAKVEHKFSRLDWFKNYVNAQQSFVEFGEKFGTITATAEADVLVDKNRVNSMKEEMGIADKGGAK